MGDETTPTIDWEALKAVFPIEHVHWRIGATNETKTKGLALAYIDARAVMDRLDDVIGPENWTDAYSDADGTTMCRLALRIDGEWISKEDGAGDTEMEPEKGSLSDAFKRAAVKWGIGRYLYSLPAQWVNIKNRRIIQVPRLPDWALPATESSAKDSEHMTPEQLERFRGSLQRIAENAGPERWQAALKNLNLTDKILQQIVGKEEATAVYKQLQAELDAMAIDDGPLPVQGGNE